MIGEPTNHNRRIVWALVAVVLGVGLVAALRFTGTAGLYLSTGLNRAPQSTATVTSCTDICAASCEGFATTEDTKTCLASCSNLCAKNY